VLVDCGEATQHQLLRTRLSPLQLQAILITHVHGDHCYGLPGLLASCQLNGRTAPLTLVGPAAVWRYLQAVIEHTELRIDYPLEFVEVSSTLELKRGGFSITATELSHRTECWAYRLQEAHVPVRLDTERLQTERGDAIAVVWPLAARRARDVIRWSRAGWAGILHCFASCAGSGGGR
jgi:ribonuclease Z